MALTSVKHGEVAKYFSYDMHQMQPDMFIANIKFLESLSQKKEKSSIKQLNLPMRLSWSLGPNKLEKLKQLLNKRWV